MPNLDFYAAQHDHEPIMGHIFECQEFQVFEHYSKPDNEIVELRSASHLRDHFGFESWTDAPTIHLQLLAIGSSGQPTFERIELKPGALGSASYRYSCVGWGLIQLYLEAPKGGYLRNSHTNHFSPSRAAGWAEVDRMGRQSPATWNWDEVRKASGRLNSFIRRLGVEKVGSRPVLPTALDLRGKGLVFTPILK